MKKVNWSSFSILRIASAEIDSSHVLLHSLNTANLVAMTALRLVSRMKRDWIVAGRRPAGICAAALLIASRAHGFERQHHDVTKVLKVCGLTVMTRVKEFEATPSANLTLDEFHKKDIDEEVDPPIFTKNRIQEARAKAVAERDVDLLTSGALDNPNMKGKWASKWRDTKAVTERDQEYADMYTELENEMADNTTLESEMNRATKREDNGEGIETGTISFTRAEEHIEHRRPTGVSTLHGEITYPLGKNHRPLILPNQATAEELASPTQKSEDVLNFAEWKAAVPSEAADEVLFLFRSDDEVREREAVFNAQNKEYLEMQQQKESELLMAEAATRAKHEDELAQEEGRKRYLKSSRSRKRKDGWDPNELTTEEALLEVVRTRKISRKINYDAMSALFDDSGDFSTDLLNDRQRKREDAEVGEV
jgi:transcription factor IIIB subunit 2